ncbi:hypothetical protein B0T25DRAFT_574690 [Lasiosphaeria hispida]|uniref:Ankyrin repeat protein n=1 Tax=Lasiosphaeria hispida TaxID=260671 RepID=A0AAJ0H597_9PEZI|nr:hypothetical protein B0T25DRAFT_574690 [Lasiosphaeria hispida]
MAIENDNKEIVELFLSRPGLIYTTARNTADRFVEGIRVLDMAVQTGNPAIVQLLLDCKIFPPHLLGAPLQRAVSQDDKEIVKCLLDYAATPSVVDNLGLILVHTCTSKPSAEVRDLLIERKREACEPAEETQEDDTRPAKRPRRGPYV